MPRVSVTDSQSCCLYHRVSIFTINSDDWHGIHLSHAARVQRCSTYSRV